MKTRLLSLIVTIFILLSIPLYANAADISLFVNGSEVSCDVPPVIRNNRTMVPVRALFDCFGADVSWNERSRQVTVVSGGTNIVFTIDSDIVYVNSVPDRLDSVPIILNNRTLVPVRFISETLKYNVSWDADSHSVYIQSPGNTEVSNTKITSMMYSVSGNTFVIKFNFSAPLSSYSLYNMDNPARTVLELDGASFHHEADNFFLFLVFDGGIFAGGAQ